jgi:hypothetical protein
MATTTTKPVTPRRREYMREWQRENYPRYKERKKRVELVVNSARTPITKRCLQPRTVSASCVVIRRRLGVELLQ